MQKRERLPVSKHSSSDQDRSCADHDDAPLSPQGAFVVQFCIGALMDQRHRSGRIEHFVSGRAKRFESFAELRTFIEQVLGNVKKNPLEGSHPTRGVSGQEDHCGK